MNATQIRQKVRATIDDLTTTNAKSYIRRIVQDEILNLIPVVKEATRAREKYYTSPSIVNGSRKQEADDEAKNAINGASLSIWSKWAKDFKTLVTQDELTGMIEDELIDLTRAQCEKLWVGTIAKELTTRRA